MEIRLGKSMHYYWSGREDCKILTLNSNLICQKLSKSLRFFRWRIWNQNIGSKFQTLTPNRALICQRPFKVDPLFPSVSVMLCSPFFSFQNRRFSICISFSFWKKEKPSVLKLKLKVFRKLENRSMLQFHIGIFLY